MGTNEIKILGATDQNTLDVIFVGSTLNPPTHAHVDMVEFLFEKYKNNPNLRIFIAPVYDHVLPDTKFHVAPFEDRLEMTKLAFADLIRKSAGRIEVTEIERDACLKHGKKVGSVVVIPELAEQLKQRYNANISMSMVLGGDTYKDAFSGKWIQFENLINFCKQIHVFERGTEALQNELEIVNVAELKMAAELKLLKDANSTEAKKIADLELYLSRLPAIKQAIAANDMQAKIVVQQNAITDIAHQKASSTDARNTVEGALLNVCPQVYVYMMDSSRDLYKQARIDSQQKLEKEAVAASASTASLEKPLLNLKNAQQLEAAKQAFAQEAEFVNKTDFFAKVRRH